VKNPDKITDSLSFNLFTFIFKLHNMRFII
jgi:hypothetical protein